MLFVLYFWCAEVSLYYYLEVVLLFTFSFNWTIQRIDKVERIEVYNSTVQRTQCTGVKLQ